MAEKDARFAGFGHNGFPKCGMIVKLNGRNILQPIYILIIVRQHIKNIIIKNIGG